MAAAYLLRLLGAIKKTRALSRWLVQMFLYLCKVGDKKLTTSNTFVHHAGSVDECVPCSSEEVEHDILSSRFERFHDAVAPFSCTESVSGSSSSLQSSLSQYFSPRATCYSYRDVHDFVAQTGKSNYLVARVPVPSTLNISTWRELLQDYEDSVCDFLEFGWPVGFMPTTLPVFDLRTHRDALLFSEQVTAYLTKEISLARVAGPFDAVPFTDVFVVSPLNTVPKRDWAERRVIVDLSWPCGTSVLNEGIPSDSLSYPTIDSIVDAVISLGPGFLFYKRDLKKAYRLFPVHPKDYHLLGYTWDNQLYFDTVLTMGLRSAGMACQRSTSAVSWISRQQGRSLFNYLDDFIGVSSPSTATSDFQALGDLLTSLGLQESSEKSCSPSPVMICLGVQLDTNNFTLSVSSERLCELETLLHRWLTTRTATKSALQSLVGKLVFVSKCVLQSRVFIARILAVLGKLRHNHHHATLTAAFRKDFVWWRRFLREYNDISMINITKWTSPDAAFSTDACLAGCGGVCDDQYLHGVFPPFISEQNLDISSLELLTVFVALKLWGARSTGLPITFRCDNEAAVTVVNTGRCRNPFMNSCLREICYFAALHEFEVCAVHIPGVSNHFADLLSRRDSCSLAAKAQFLQRVQRNHLQEVPVPDGMFQFHGTF